MQVRTVHPSADKWLPRCRLRLCDLVFVMREDEVDAARVQIERLTEVAHAHCRALEVPSRSPWAEWAVPRWLARLRRLPQDKVAHVILAVLVRLDALTDAHRFGIEASEAPVGWPR